MAGVAGLTILVSAGFDVGWGTTTVDRTRDLKTFVSALNTDIASCNSSLRDSISAYSEVVGGRPDERITAQAIVAGDEPNCTPEANSSLYDMATTDAPATLRSFHVQPVVRELDTWSFPDAAAAINDIGRLLARPGLAPDAGARHDLRIRLTEMTGLARSAQMTLDITAGLLRTRVDHLDLGASSSLEAGRL